MVDQISILPMELRSKLLSLLPTRTAVRTCVLSQEWEQSWKLIRTIRLDDEAPLHDYERLLSFNEHVLEGLGKISLDEFHLHITNSLLAPPFPLLESAISRHVTELELSVHSLELPPAFFTCQVVKKLRLRFTRWVSDSWERMAWDPELHISLPSLLSLDTSANREVYENVIQLINGAPALRHVHFSEFGFVPWIGRLNLSPNIRHLEFAEPTDHCLEAVFQVLEQCPFLEKLSFGQLRDYNPQQQLAPPSCLQTLKTFKIHVHGLDSETEFIEYIMSNAKNLMTLQISFADNISPEMSMHMCGEFIDFCNAAHHCKLQLV